MKLKMFFGIYFLFILLSCSNSVEIKPEGIYSGFEFLEDENTFGAIGEFVVNYSENQIMSGAGGGAYMVSTTLYNLTQEICESSRLENVDEYFLMDTSESFPFYDLHGHYNKGGKVYEEPIEISVCSTDRWITFKENYANWKINDSNNREDIISFLAASSFKLVKLSDFELRFEKYETIKSVGNSAKAIIIENIE